ncbi:tetratricopeptide repeat protein [Aurantiacibacter sp. MUD61]|uniref:tetratricopeptide repeat protein n=1 Tax=Aurantiacibacter sp. MUD61 TaxID=3009083 RepID=UPI0022F02AC6|nr:tetratricopeptide repeat protein [Aurantiacibacter sp. MUD61]
MKIRPFLLASALAVSVAACGVLDNADPLETGLAAFGERDYQTARVSLANAMNAEGADPRAAEYYARTLLELGDGESAERIIAMLRDRSDPPADLDGLWAHAALLQNDYDAALERAEAAGDTPLAQWVAIQSLGQSDRFDEALALADSAIEAHPEDARLLALRGAMAISQRQPAFAKEMADRALAADDENLESLLLAGQLRLLRSDFAAAQEYYERAASEHPSSMRARFAIAAVEADLGDYDAADAHLQTILDTSPNHPLALLLQARLAFAQGELDDANDIIQSAEAEIGAIPQGRLLMGEIAYLRGFPSLAIAHLQDFLGQMPGHQHGSTLLASALAEEGDVDEAWDIAAPLADSATASPQLLALASSLAQERGVEDRFAARLAPNDLPDDFANRASAAQAALNDGDDAEADRLYSSLITDGGDRIAVIMNNGALAALGAGRNAEALQRARAAHALAPRDPRVRDTLGWVLLENGQASAGLEHLSAAIDGAPGNLQIRWHYANALVANGRNAEARGIIRGIREYATAEQRAAMDALLERI